jgi:hypothetical protein
MEANNTTEVTAKPDEPNKRFNTGMKVITCLGEGKVVGKESFYGGKLERILVRLKDPSKWSFGHQTDVAAFFPSELSRPQV